MTKQEAIDTEDTTDKLINLFKHCNKVKFILDGVGEEEFETSRFRCAVEALQKQAKIVNCVDCNIRNKDGYCMRQMTFNLITMVEDTDYCSWGDNKELS